ncbi:protease [Sinorhizobium medicae]|nr:protease [Sinorhizobium medicae]MQV53886.1 protease [Sinorhizobium medicae]MQV71531.1 protease [Sinorhizobium medicae]
MSAFDFSSIYYGYSYVQSGTLFRVDYGDGTVEEFRGSGFRYNSSGEPTAGTVTGYAAFYSGQRLFYVEGGSVAATKIVAAAKTYSTSDDLGVISEVLKGNDTINGGSLADLLLGFGGNDVINGNGGNDILWGYDGADTITGGSGQDEINGGAGYDTASYATAAASVVANLFAPSGNAGDAYGDTFRYIENLTGSRFSDTLTGDKWVNILTGGDGNDVLTGGAGADKLYGGSGWDTASYANASAGVVANLGSPSGNTGDAAGDVYSSIENLVGSGHADELYGTGGMNSITGGAGDDIIASGWGNDSIYGGAGADRLVGGAGADKFLFKALSDSKATSSDSIFDFLPSEQDRIDVSAIDANWKVSGNEAFTFVGTASFTGAGGELRYVKHASDTYIHGDVNGDKVSDFKIHLDDAMILTKDYFIL